MLKENLVKVKGYSINISVSWSLMGIIYREVRILEVIEKFKWLLDDVDYDKSDEVLKVIELLKCAVEHGGRFREMRTEERSLIISISFSTIEDMIEFRDKITL